LQVNRKTHEGEDHPQRDQQFSHISQRVKQFHEHHQPVISVDAKKKELLGEYRNHSCDRSALSLPELQRASQLRIQNRGNLSKEMLCNQSQILSGCPCYLA